MMMGMFHIIYIYIYDETRQGQNCIIQLGAVAYYMCVSYNIHSSSFLLINDLDISKNTAIIVDFPPPIYRYSYVSERLLTREYYANT